MTADNAVQAKSFAFAVRCVKVAKVLQQQRSEYVLTKQLIRSGTSIGANIEEALGGQTRKDFAHKLQIAYKEAREAQYWLRLLAATQYLTAEEEASLLADIKELIALLTSILNTLKRSDPSPPNF